MTPGQSTIRKVPVPVSEGAAASLLRDAFEHASEGAEKGPPPRGEMPAEVPLPEELATLLPEGTYTVEGFIGQGGMGAVYKGTQVRLQRTVAIKIMRRHQGMDSEFEERFRREALALARLNHPHVVTVIDYGEAGPDFLYIVMEFVDGTDLMGVIRSGQMTQDAALKLLPQICDALQFAHQNGIVHRDIKPSNILLTRDGRIKVADFGLAKRLNAGTAFHTESGIGMGTPDYAAPEQFDQSADIDHRADIYALGVMIYQMITGKLPRGAWQQPSQEAQVDKHWDGIVNKAMQVEPDKRYETVSALKQDVSTIQPRVSGLSEGKPTSGTMLQRHKRKVKWALAAVLLLVIAAIIFGRMPAKPARTESGGRSPSIATAGARPAPAVPTRGGVSPNAPWKSFPALPQMQKTADGWLQLRNGILFGRVTIPSVTGRNFGIRATIRYTVPSTPDYSPAGSRLQVRITSNANFNVFVTRHMDSFAISEEVSGRRGAAPSLARGGIIPPEQADEPFTLELYAVGKILVARCRDQEIRAELDDAGATREGGIALSVDSSDLVRDVAILDLNALSEADALKMIGASPGK